MIMPMNMGLLMGPMMMIEEANLSRVCCNGKKVCCSKCFLFVENENELPHLWWNLIRMNWSRTIFLIDSYSSQRTIY